MKISELEKEYMKNNDTMQLPYRQGEILAHNWDTQIKLATHQKKSLDDVMRSLLNDVQTTHKKLTLNQVSNVATRYKKNDVTSDIENIYSGQLVVPNKNSLGPCVRLEYLILSGSTESVPQFILNKDM